MGPGLTLRENLPKIQWLGVNLMFPLHPFTERMDEAKPDTMLTCRFLEFVKRILKSKGGVINHQCTFWVKTFHALPPKKMERLF